jgi:hypothetical protein
MLVLLISLLLTAEIGHALQCITNCSVGEFGFEEPFRIPDGQCQQRIEASECTVRVDFKYHDQVYTVEFGKNRSSADFIYISSSPYLSYTTNYYCSKETNCVFSPLQKRINQMVRRTYNATHIYEQLAPLIENPLRTHAVKCYNMTKKIVKCSHDQVCGLSYDQQAQDVRARGCQLSPGARVFVYDADYYSALHIECTRNLCNDDATIARIKSILASNNLTDANGRRIAVGTKEMASFSLLTFALISIIISYF